ncbi:MAG: hypothetical protein M5U26_04865 [Planctomycetota bacterium]|nr:hypothetical protein [Planctomycetota bacterium]
MHMTDRHYFSDISGQYRKVDVTVEYTEDGESWKEAGTLRGISGEADFLPVALPDVPLKGVRLTGTPEPYRRRYMAGAHGGMLAVPFHCPLFGWRFLASGGGKE